MTRLSDEDRAYTARMLGGYGKVAIVAALAVIAALVAWAVLS